LHSSAVAWNELPDYLKQLHLEEKLKMSFQLRSDMNLLRCDIFLFDFIPTQTVVYFMHIEDHNRNKPACGLYILS